MKLTGPDRLSGSQRGFAIFVVLWFLVLLSAIGTYMLVAARSQTALAHNIVAAAKAEALADAGVSQAAFELSETNEKARWQADGSRHDLVFPGGTLAIRISDESAKINVNLATVAQLQGLLQALGIATGQAKSVATAIGVWVGTVKTPSQAENWLNQYRDAGLRYEPPQAPAVSLDELHFVLGITPRLFALMEPYATVYTSRAVPDRKGASRIMQQALAFANAIQPAGDQAQPSALPRSSQGDAAGPLTSADTLAQPSSQSPLVASVDVLAHSREGGVFARHAVVRLDSRDAKGYVVLDWQRVDANQ
jgi:general secretion pathway protein K